MKKLTPAPFLILFTFASAYMNNFKKSIRDTTFSNWKGRNVGRGKPTDVANPQSPAQQAHRGKMVILNEIFRPVLAFIHQGFINYRSTIGQWAAAVKFNLVNGFTATNLTDGAPVWADIVFAKGSIQATDASTAAGDASDGTITVTWPTTATGAGQSATDKAYFAVINKTTLQWVTGSSGTVARSVGTQTISGLTITAGSNYQYYIFFKAADGSDVSDSRTGTLTVAA